MPDLRLQTDLSADITLGREIFTFLTGNAQIVNVFNLITQLGQIETPLINFEISCVSVTSDARNPTGDHRETDRATSWQARGMLAVCLSTRRP